MTVQTISEVPFFVLHLGKTKAKALFLVPPNLIPHLLQRPVTCRGSFFVLEKESEETVSASYESYDVDCTAAEIAMRLKQRIEDCSHQVSKANLNEPTSSINVEAGATAKIHSKSLRLKTHTHKRQPLSTIDETDEFVPTFSGVGIRSEAEGDYCVVWAEL
mmetsp:Transcript_30785/g.46699  ORF Transcript_30785/g.46699 Transcript_30785/m.46699 type:complete len:161 (+) Transcript_30785:139-621(+)